MGATEYEKKRRKKIVTELHHAAMQLRNFQRDDLARQVDDVADNIYIGQVTENPLR